MKKLFSMFVVLLTACAFNPVMAGEGDTQVVRGPAETQETLPDAIISDEVVGEEVAADDAGFLTGVRDYATKKYREASEWFAQVKTEYEELMSKTEADEITTESPASTKTSE